jgi:DNA-binding NarL/FixJ family response regulator/signal transduction histidine kinase
VTVTEEPASVVGTPAAAGSESARVAGAQTRAALRLRGQRDTLRPLGLAVIAVVVLGTFNGDPQPALQGSGLWVALALVVFVASLAATIRNWFIERGLGFQAAVIAAMGAAGVALAALQPDGAAGLAVGAAVWTAVARLPLALAIMLGAVTTVALDVASALAGSSSSAVLASTLLCALIGLIAYFLKQAREGQDRTEVLLAQLEDAREEQTRAAAIAERGRIASELHDVLAHSLSGAAIQLQGARLLAERERATTKTREAIDRAGELVKDGLTDARQAVGALRGERLPGVNELGALIDGFSTDMALEVTLRVEGSARTLPVDAGLALYRGAQEALTNVARYAPGASTTVVLSYGSDHTTLSVEDRVPATAPRAAGLADVGGGRGLASMREHERRPDRRRLARRAAGARVTGAPIRVLVADDQRTVRDGLTMLVGLIDGVEVVGAACDGVEAVELAQAARPDVVLMDLRMPRMEGAEATRQIRAELPDTQVLVLTTYADDESLFPALQAGARGYLTKDASAEEIEQAIRALVAGETHLDPTVQQRLVAAVLDTKPISDAQAQSLPDDLTPREAEVLKLIASGLSNAEIAEALVVSQATVKTHVNRIFYKTGARDRAQAVRYAYRHGMA